MSDTTKAIVIATALSDASDEVVRTGVAAARALGAAAWLVHSLAALPRLGTAGGAWIGEPGEGLRESLARQAERTGLAALPGFSADRLRLAMGSTPGQIVELARRLQARLIVVGAAEGGPLRRIGLGSTADAVIRQAPCPVLVVRSGSAFPPSRVEFAVDLSPISAHALRQGRDLLSRLGVDLAGTEALFVLDPIETASLFQFRSNQVERFALDELRRFLEANGAGGCPVHLCTGYPWQEILKVLESRRADLVVLGTHGRRGFGRFLLGSVAAGVMRLAACNVLVVPPGAELQQEGAGEPATELAGADWSYVADEAVAPASQP